MESRLSVPLAPIASSPMFPSEADRILNTRKVMGGQAIFCRRESKADRSHLSALCMAASAAFLYPWIRMSSLGFSRPTWFISLKKWGVPMARRSKTLL